MEKLTVEQKFAKVLIDLRAIRPFYSALYESIDKIESTQTPTMGVDSHNLYYNNDFVDSKEYPELLFIVLHELAHISLMHAYRGNGKNTTLFNVAADLVINRMLGDEFGIEPGKTSNQFNIKMPMNILYSSEVSLDEDSTEALYYKFLNQASKNGYNSNGVGTFVIDNTDGNGNAGNGGNKESESKDISNGDGEESHMKDNDTVVIVDKDTGEFVDTGEDASSKEYNAKKVLSNAKVKVEMSSKSAGTGSSRLEVFVKELLKSRIDWRKLLKRYCVSLHNSDMSFSRPDKRFSYQSAIYPGQVETDESYLKDIKIAIDTSMSVSDTDLKYILGQINDIIKQYKTTAELICWDADVQSTYSMSDVIDIYKHGLLGRGGTDAGSIFRYFDSKKCKVAPKLTLVFTDGYFDTSMFNPKWNRKYKDTIWVMTRDYNKSYIPPFGKLAIAKFED